MEGRCAISRSPKNFTVNSNSFFKSSVVVNKPFFSLLRRGSTYIVIREIQDRTSYSSRRKVGSFPPALSQSFSFALPAEHFSTSFATCFKRVSVLLRRRNSKETKKKTLLLYQISRDFSPRHRLIVGSPLGF